MKSGKIIFWQIKFFSLLLPCVVLSNFGAVCQAANIFVDDNICPQTGTGTSGTPYCSIEYALNQAVNGDTVYVHAGTYAESVVMKTGVDVRNVSGEQPVIITSTADNHVFFDKVNTCTLDGFVLDDSSRTTPQGHAIVYVAGDQNNPGYGLAIRNCEITGAQHQEDAVARTGIRLKGKLSVEITGNIIKNMRVAGIAVKKPSPDTLYDSTVTMQGNIISQNGDVGIYLQGSAGNRIIIGGNGDAANTVSDNGFFGKGSGMRLLNLQGVSIDNNNIFNNSHAGIALVNVNTVAPHITRNTIHDNLAAGINIGGDSTLTVGSDNEIFQNNRAGITFYTAGNSKFNTPGSSAPVTITGNNIHTNANAGISIIDHVTGLLTINGNTIHQNERAGVAFFNRCRAIISENEIRDHTGAAGIFTGSWLGETPPASCDFERSNGPVELTISRNKIYDNLSGMRLDHASGTISNNLVYNNTKSGIRFSGDDVAPYEPFGVVWGITAITNNTVTDNGTVVDNVRWGSGGGIVYDDITVTIDPHDGSTREFYDPPVNNRNQGSRFIQNNIVAYNATAGINDAACTTARDYNLYFFNQGVEELLPFVPSWTGGCVTGVAPTWTGNPNELFADPLFIDRTGYRLQPGSPAKNSGNDNRDMGAYGGSNPITW